MSSTSSISIAIVGAGPAGLLLGRLLHLSSIPFTVFESDTDPSSRGQGGALDLHTDTGLAAIKKADLWPAFTKHARYDGEAIQMVNEQLSVFFQNGGSSGEDSSSGRPEIDRHKLRQIMLESVPAERIRWGKRLREVVAVTATGNEGEDAYELQFVDGTIESGFSLVVGADGGWSKVRSLLADEKPYYSGVGGVTLQISNAAERAPELYSMVNRGSYFAWSFARGIVVHQLGDGSLYVNAWGKLPEDWTAERQTAEGGKLDIETDPAVRTAFLDGLYAGWSPKLRAFYRCADPDFTETRKAYMLPVSWRWPHRRGLTLVGDAAHMMTPFAGEGVNVSLTDAMHLADAIIATSADHKEGKDALDELDRRVIAFEDEMYERSREVRELTKGCLDDMSMLLPMDDWFGSFAGRIMPPQMKPMVDDAIARARAKRQELAANA